MGALGTIRTLLGGSADDDGSEFEERSISALADYQLGYLGTYRYEDDGTALRVGRRFDVYIDDEYRNEGRPVAELREERYEGGDDDPIETDTEEFVVDVKPGLTGARLKNEIEDALEDWHRTRAPGPDARSGD